MTRRQLGESDHFPHVALGSHDAFARLYDEFAPEVYGIASRAARSPEEATAITIETFRVLWRHAARLRVDTEVCRIAAAVALLHIRASRE